MSDEKVINHVSEGPKVAENPSESPMKNYLKTCFEDVLSGKEVSFDLKTLNFIIIHELRMDLLKLDDKLRKVLPYMLVSYIKTWDGWNSNENRKLNDDEWFMAFKKYVVSKLVILINVKFHQILKKLKADDDIMMNVPEKIDKSTQCNSREHSTDFYIDIQCPPSLMNSIIFSSDEENLYLKTHPLRDSLLTTNYKAMLNWSYVEVEFISPTISFTRQINPSYKRFLFLTNKKTKIEDSTSRKLSIKYKKPLENVSKPDLINLVKTYLLELQHYRKFDQSRVEEISSILSELICDLTETNVQLDISNLPELSFNIGGSVYFRRKKISNESATNQNSIPGSYAEILTPRCAIMFKERCKNGKFNQSALPIISYNCLFCKKKYEGLFAFHAFRAHREEHRMEQDVVCFSCHKPLNIQNLYEDRWKHKCE